MMPRRISIDICIEPRRILYKQPKTCLRQFSNMRAKPFQDISAAGCFKIANGVFP
jgi:hypothetical protein